MNALLNYINSNSNQIPYGKITTDCFIPSLEKLIIEAKDKLKEIEDCENPTFESILVPLEKIDYKIDSLSSIFFSLNHAHTNDELTKLAPDFSKWLITYKKDLVNNEIIFSKIEHIYKNIKSLKLNIDEETLVTDYYDSFVRNGAKLSKEDQKILKEVEENLSLTSLNFGDNVLKDTNSVILPLSKEDVEGIPTENRKSFELLAKSKELDAPYAVNLQGPYFIPFMKYSNKRELREKLYKRFLSRSFNTSFDNTKNIKKIISLRLKKAQLLGYKSFAELVLEKRMVGSVNKVNHFLDMLFEKFISYARNDLNNIAEFAKKTENLDKLMPWDFSYFAEKYKEKYYSFSDKEFKKYFELNHTIQKMFELAGELYDLEFKPNLDYPKYEESVVVYDVFEKGDFIGTFFLDMYARESKKQGAWMSQIRSYNSIEETITPIISICCNYAKQEQVLLSVSELITLFHEFGHALHGLLTKCRFPSQAGTNVKWDFVELPSQIMENWPYEKEILKRLSKNVNTGDEIDEKLAENFIKTSKYLESYNTIRQLNFALLDMAWHSIESDKDWNVKLFEDEATKKTQLFPTDSKVCISTAFGHIFQGGYAAGYYSYKWAEVLEADAFEKFKENMPNIKSIGKLFKEEILYKGGSVDPLTLFINFRGREPSEEALLRRAL